MATFLLKSFMIYYCSYALYYKSHIIDEILKSQYFLKKKIWPF